MTDRSKLLALAEAVEKLTGPDREVDVRISLGLSGVAHSDEDVADLLRVRDEPTGYGKYSPADEYVPAYTASLDAAMTLVPEGWCKTVADYWAEGDEKPPFYADCGDLEALKAGVDGVITVSYAATPALALCAAALRAQAEALS